jgi:alkyl hydroperoxide reductase subunit AhpC
LFERAAGTAPHYPQKAVMLARNGRMNPNNRLLEMLPAFVLISYPRNFAEVCPYS